jgi:hypothetical protein
MNNIFYQIELRSNKDKTHLNLTEVVISSQYHNINKLMKK